MKYLFQNNQLEGLALFSNKTNWKSVLHALKEQISPCQFFVFFDSERGYNLKIFCKHFDAAKLKSIEDFLNNLPKTQAIIANDPLFENAPENTLHRLQLIPKSFDISYENELSDEGFIAFLCQTSDIIIEALDYNDFFIHEKNRLNFAIQLVFMALVRADKYAIAQNLNSVYDFSTNMTDNQSPLINFFKEVQQIETEGEIETWVLDWLNISAVFLQKNKFQTLVESICLMLEIAGFSSQLLLISQYVLNKNSEPVGVEI
jgi:hypothetical protein